MNIKHRKMISRHQEIVIAALLFLSIAACTSTQSDKDKLVGRYRNGKDGRVTITNEGDHLMFQFIRWKETKKLTRISDTSYVVGNTQTKVSFKELPGNQIDLVIFDDPQHNGSHLKVGDDEIVPYEYLLKGDYQQALKGYDDLVKSGDMNEAKLNHQGYDLLQSGNTKAAINNFRISNALFPGNVETAKKLAELENVSEK